MPAAQVREALPAPAISVVETDCRVEFEAPKVCVMCDVFTFVAARGGAVCRVLEQSDTPMQGGCLGADSGCAGKGSRGVGGAMYTAWHAHSCVPSMLVRRALTHAGCFPPHPLTLTDVVSPCHMCLPQDYKEPDYKAMAAAVAAQKAAGTSGSKPEAAQGGWTF